MTYLVFLVAGGVGGLLIGIIGTGSSLVMLPTLIIIFSGLFPEHDYLRLAVGTTVAAMTFGAITAAITHWRANNVDVSIFRAMIVPYTLGSLAGPWMNRFMPTQWLKIYLCAIIFVIGIQMLSSIAFASVNNASKNVNLKATRPIFLLIAAVSSMGGVASGMLAIPYLSRYSMPMQRVIGTSTTGAAVFTVAGLIGYVSAGWNMTNLPAATIGFIYLPAFIIMSTMLVTCVPLGVRMAKYADDKLLKKAFGIFLIISAGVIGLR